MTLVHPVDSQVTMQMDISSSQMIFYFDTDDPSMMNQFIPHIKKFGGDCTNFFSKDVTHLITSRIPSKKGEITITTLSNRGGTRGHSVTLPPSSANVSLLCPSSIATVPITTMTAHSSSFDRFGASPINPSSAISIITPSVVTPSTGSTLSHNYHRHSNTLRHVPSSTPTTNTNNGKENILINEGKDLIESTRPSMPLKMLASTSQSISGSSCDPSSMLQKSRDQQKFDLIHKAKTMNTTIWTLDQLLSYLKSCYENISENVDHIPLFSGMRRAATRRKETDLMNCLLAEKQQYQQQRSANIASITTPNNNMSADSLAIRHSSRLSCNSTSKNILTPGTSSIATTIAQQSQFVPFEHPFILIEDAHGSYRSFFKEFKPTRTSKPPTLPCLYLNSPQGHCPFIKPSSSSNRKQKWDNNTENDQMAHIQTMHPIDSSIVLKWKSDIHAKYSKVKKPGYCECCLEKYSDLVEHSKQSHHRKFAIHKDNFAQLDNIISDLRRPMKIQSITSMISSCPGTPRSSSPFANPATCHDSLLSVSCKRKERPNSGSSKRKLPDYMFAHAIDGPESDEFTCNNNQDNQCHNIPSSPLCQKYAHIRTRKLEVI